MKKVEKEMGTVGRYMVRGIERDEDEEDEEEEEEEEKEEKEPTAEELNSIRYILASKAIKDAIDKENKKLLGDQADDDMMMFNTAFSQDAIVYMDGLLRRVDKQKDLKKKCALLLGGTLALHMYNDWIHDNEFDDGEFAVVKMLGDRWKQLLKKSDKELGIDSEFTRPAILCVLQGMKKVMHDTEQEYVFKPF